MTDMKIDFKKLTADNGITMARLASEMVSAGHFKNKVTAYITIQNWTAGKGKSIKLDLLLWIRNRFNVNIIDFFQY